jgi:ABC-2 type transporter
LYLGRTAVFLITNTIFALVYLKARKYDQDQAINKMWINIWHVGVASNMGVVAVYALNEEFKSIVREAKNGMTGPMTYVLAKTILVLPVMFVFAIFALGIPSIVIMDFPGEKFGKAIVLWSAVMYVFECVAECFSVWIDDLIVGMLAFTSYWFGFFLFSGFLISQEDLVWPFKLFFHIFPFSYYLRSQMYNLLIDTEWTPCNPLENIKNSPICFPAPTGKLVLTALRVAYPVIEAEDTFAQDLAAMIAIALFFKALYIAGVYAKTSKTSKFVPNGEYVATISKETPTAAPVPALSEEQIIHESESYHRRVPLFPEPFEAPPEERLEL